MTRMLPILLLLLTSAMASGQDAQPPDMTQIAEIAIANRSRGYRIAKADDFAARGVELTKQGQYEDALGQLTRALDLLPDARDVRFRRIAYAGYYHEAHLGLAWQEFWQGKWDSAFERFRRSIVDWILIRPLTEVRIQYRPMTIPRSADGWGIFLTIVAALSTVAGFYRGRRADRSGLPFFLRPAMISLGVLAVSVILVALAPRWMLTPAEAFSRLGWIGAYGMTVTLVPYLAGKIGGFATRSRVAIRAIDPPDYGFQPKGSSSI